MNYRFWDRDRRKPRDKGDSRTPCRSRERRARVESLEDRLLLSAIPVTFNYGDVSGMPVYLEVSGQLTAPYTTKTGTPIPANTWVYYDPNTQDYAVAGTSSPFDFKITGSGTVVQMPNTQITSGQIVIGIGSAPIITYSAQGVSTPTAATNPTNYFGLFEYAIKAAGVNIDMSEVDQVGFPFTITTTPPANNPADAGVGINVTRSNMFSQYTQFIAAQGNAAAPFQQSLTYGNGYRLLAPQNSFPSPAAPVTKSPSYASGGNLNTHLTYYYWVTAIGSTGGETGVSNMQIAKPYDDPIKGLHATVNLSWSPFQGAVSYRSIAAPANNPATSTYIGPSSTTTFQDPGDSPQGGAPPNSGYWYNPLSSYFTTQLDNFFTHYVTNTFNLTRDGYNFTGNTTTYQGYTALVLTAPGLAGNFVIYDPFFSTNTGNPALPAAPSWMPSATQTPGQMILANDGVFNTDGVPGVTGQPGLTPAEESILADVENSIVSAFNRGIADNFNVIPNNWASEPLLESAQANIPGSLSSGTTYYYVVTSEFNYFTQSTASIERTVTPNAPGEGVSLTILPSTAPIAYDIYRSQTPGSGYLLVTRILNDPKDPVTTLKDSGWPYIPGKTPVLYYAPGTHSNWYSAFLHQDSTTNPASGVSINGLAYGFPYDDQGGQSTDVQGNFSAVTVTIQPWGGSQSSGPVLQPSGIQFLTQPGSAALGSTTNVTFLALFGPRHTPPGRGRDCPVARRRSATLVHGPDRS